MTVDPKHHKYFVARRGEVIRRIGDEFGGVVVSFPRQGVATDKVNFFQAGDFKLWKVYFKKHASTNNHKNDIFIILYGSN